MLTTPRSWTTFWKVSKFSSTKWLIGIPRSSSMVLTSSSGPWLSAASTLVMLFVPGIGRNRSRGIDKIEAVFVRGSRWRSIVTSLRAPPTCEHDPNDEACWPLRAQREFDPTRRMFSGCPATGAMTPWTVTRLI
jgi:hypothetical protein